MTKSNRARCRAGALVGLLFGTLHYPASAQELSVANSSQYAGRDRWNWTIYVVGDEAILDKVRCVEYTLHRTFPHPLQKVCKRGNPNFSFGLRSNGWGTFDIPVKIIFHNGQTRSLQHSLRFESSAVKQPLSISVDNTARQVRPGWWAWTVFIRAEKDVLDEIQCVEYTLHSTFANPVREVCVRGPDTQAFALSESAWGTFQIPVRVFLKDGQVQELKHSVQFKRWKGG
jgi:transcription initiation factor IIF auxiliary subunit